MDKQIIESIHQRIDEHHAFLSDRLDALQRAIDAFEQRLASRLDAHEDYHRANEHRFGLLRLAERHPLRLSGIAFLAGAAAYLARPEGISGLGPLLLRWLESIVR